MSRILAAALMAALPLACWSDDAPPPPPAPAAAPEPAPAPLPAGAEGELKPLGGSAQPAQPASPPAPAAPAAPAAPPTPVALKPITTVKPNLPDAACQQRLSGYVDLEFAILPDGKVADVKVLKSQPAGVFDAAASVAIAGWTYPAQEKPVKGHHHMALSLADCRAEQLRAAMPAEGAAPVAQNDCPQLHANGRKDGDQIDVSESGRSVLTGQVAQGYSAPDAHCFITGRKLKPGRLTAYVEYQGFSLVGPPKKPIEDAVWVRSSDLRDQDN